MKETNSEILTILTSKDVCELLKISTRTLLTYRKSRILPFMQIGRKIYYELGDIEIYLKKHYINANYQK